MLTGLATPAWGQEVPQPVAAVFEVKDRPDPEKARAEQVEILRRILAAKLQRWEARQTNAGCAQCHNGSAGGGTFNSSPWVHGFAFPTTSDDVHTFWLDTGDPKRLESFTLANSLVASPREVQFRMTRPVEVEGVYLKGHGIVYTLTLPPTPPGQPDTPAAAKPLSDWERARQELQGEPAKPQAAVKPPEPSLQETILQVLAENGKHFSALPDNENITVAVTFRPETAGWHSAALGGSFWNANTCPALQGKPRPDAGKKAPAPPKPAEPKNDPGQPQAGQAAHRAQWAQLGTALPKDDYEVLGDLLVRQNKAQEAIDAYKRALQTHPASDRAAAVHRKLAQAYLQQDPDKNSGPAQQALADAAKLLEGGQKVPQPGPAKLPEKLIVTAPVGLLKGFGAGKVTLEEFTKAAHVERVK